MVHFFGILSPGFGQRVAGAEAPAKTAFFGGALAAPNPETPSRAELDALFLNGKRPDAGDYSLDAQDERFVRLCLPRHF